MCYGIAMKHIHFVGICGVTMAPLALLYKKMGWKVTGSDKAFFPPMSTYLEKNGIAIMPGFKESHLDPQPALVLVTAFITDKNPEVVEAGRLGIPIKVYADVLPKLIEKQNSVVIAGDCGKTSTTALVAWILENAGYNPNFMIGGIAKNFEHGIRQTDSNWSVIEGDEYPSSGWDNTPRFLCYSPKYLILTDVCWDHMDKFVSEKEYIDIFRELAAKVPRDGVIIANYNGANIKRAVKDAVAPVLFYNAKKLEDFSPPFPGRIWQDNSAAAITLARHLGIDGEMIKGALKSFLGLKRRQEVRFQDKYAIVIDDNAHTPVKVAGGLEAIAKMFPRYDLCVIYEPGNRSRAALHDEGYKNCFKVARKIILPRVSSMSEDVRAFNKKLAAQIHGYYKDCCYIEDDAGVLAEVKNFIKICGQKKKRASIVFMSQKGFRGMIEETISLLQ